MLRGDTLVLPVETVLLGDLNTLRQTRSQAGSETSARLALERQIAGNQKIIKDADHDWERLNARLTLVQDVSIHNNIVLRMNRLVADQKEAFATLKDLEDKAGKSISLHETKYADGLTALAPRIAAALRKYQDLAADAEVKTALAAQNPPAALGPSAEFAAAAAEFKKWQAEVESQAILLREESGTFEVDTLLNGEHFMLMVDTGASFVSLSAEAAEKLKMVPGEKDPIVELHIADGNVIQGRQMVLDSVRIGNFTLSNVTCVVLAKGLPHAPLVLGGSFLNHFIVKMDPGKNEMHLTEIKGGAHSER